MHVIYIIQLLIKYTIFCKYLIIIHTTGHIINLTIDANIWFVKNWLNNLTLHTDFNDVYKKIEKYLTRVFLHYFIKLIRN